MRKRMLIGVTATAIAFGTTLLTSAPAGAAQQGGADKEYCTEQGGKYDTFVPLAGGRELGGSAGLCVFWSKDHKTSIAVTAQALNADKPTVAELAYNHPPKPRYQRTMGNPADAYCNQLGGTYSFGDKIGSWVVKGHGHDGNPQESRELCVFGDMSAIDTWGLFYRTGGIVRGQDLTHKWRDSQPCEPDMTAGSHDDESPAGDSDDSDDEAVEY